MIFRILSLLFLLGLVTSVQAQLSEGGEPYSFRNELETKPQVFTTPKIDVPALLAEDAQDLKYNLPLRFAFGHSVALDLNGAGKWTELPNGDRIWRLSIHCPDALNINLLYSDFYLPPGAKLYLYDGAKEQVLGAFTERNNKESGRFATALIHDERLTLEYYEPLRVQGQGRISIAQIGHGYRDMDGNTAEEKSGPCQVDVNCEEGDDWQDEKKGVARIVMDGLYLCSGTLINNTANDCKPLFLTANHCLQGGVKQDAVVNPDVSGYVFYWNYEVAECGATGPIPNQTTAGGTVLANSGVMETPLHTLLGSDFALIELAENPRGAYDVYFNGWDATGNQGETGVGIHHPAGDVKKISTHNQVPVGDVYYWELFWSPTPNGHSVTEGGSSGSALFRENGRIIGQLFGGSSLNCDDPANDLGLYGRLDYSWTNDDEPLLPGDPRRRLLDWLDPIGGGTIRTVDGAYDPCNTKLVYFQSTASAVAEENVTATDGCRGYTDYTYELGITPFPRNPVVATLSANGTADAGDNLDYELLTESVTFNSVTNARFFTVRVYDDAYVEPTENITITVTPSSPSGDAVGVIGGAASQTIEISSGDVVPNSHVQTVRNLTNPAEEYLGPFGTVYFTVPGSGGMLLAIENQSGHDFGCTSVVVDNAGGTANNSWSNGTTLSKTYRVSPEFPGTAPVNVTLYIDDNEITGWEWFNNAGLDRDDLTALVFAGTATPANAASAQSIDVTRAPYGNDFVFHAQLTGLPQAPTGLTLGKFFNNQAKSIAGGTYVGKDDALALIPNLTSDFSQVRWTSATPGTTDLRLISSEGRLVRRQQLSTSAGANQIQLPVSDLPNGMYWVQLQSPDGTVQQARLIKN